MTKSRRYHCDSLQFLLRSLFLLLVLQNANLDVGHRKNRSATGGGSGATAAAALKSPAEQISKGPDDEEGYGGEGEGGNHFLFPGDSRRDDRGLDLDYPSYTEIPRTGFSCQGKANWHYYADIETNCQVFHICETQSSKISFLCEKGTVFNQRHLVCDWWYNVDCEDSRHFYTLLADEGEELEKENGLLER